MNKPEVDLEKKIHTKMQGVLSEKLQDKEFVISAFENLISDLKEFVRMGWPMDFKGSVTKEEREFITAMFTEGVIKEKYYGDKDV